MKKRFFHKVSSLLRGNGGPIALTGSTVVIGIQVGSRKSDGGNVGRLVTADLAVTLLLWAEKQAALPFLVVDLATNANISFKETVYDEVRSLIMAMERSSLEKENAELRKRVVYL